MKSVVLFSTRWLMYLTELPIILLLAAAICFNGGAPSPLKLYPMIIACCAGIIFIFIYLLRAIIINNEKIRSFGPYSTKESCIINKGKTLVLTTRPHSKIKIEVFGYDDTPAFDWIDKNDAEAQYSNLYRDFAVGGKRTIARVLRYFGASEAHINSALSDSDFEYEYPAFILKKSSSDDGDKYSIEFTKTV